VTTPAPLVFLGWFGEENAQVMVQVARARGLPLRCGERLRPCRRSCACSGQTPMTCTVGCGPQARLVDVYWAPPDVDRTPFWEAVTQQLALAQRCPV
jgi:hypothetical protein